MSDDKSAAFLTEVQANDTRYTNARIRAINIGHAQTLNDVTNCHHCKKSIKKAKQKCAGCLSRFYCSHKCRKKDAKTHRLVCPQHDTVGLGGIRFVASPLGLISLTRHKLFTNATKVVTLEDGMPCAIHAVPTGLSFCQILKRMCDDFVIVDPSLYAQLMILNKNWTPDRNRFSIFVGSAPVSSQLEVFNMPYGSAITLVPENPDVMRAFGFCQGKTTLDHFQGPRQIELVKDGDFYCGLSRTMGPLRMELHEWGDVATDDLYDWCQTLLELPTPITLGTESTWALNKEFAQTILQTRNEVFCWKAVIPRNDEEPWAESDEESCTESGEELDMDAAEQLGFLTLKDIR